MTQDEFDRRRFMKRAAAVGGVAWAAPVLTSVSPALANGSPCCTADATGLIVRVPPNGDLVDAVFDTGPDPCVGEVDTGTINTAFGTLLVQATVVCAEESSPDGGPCRASASIATLDVTGTALPTLVNPIGATALTSAASATCATDCSTNGSSSVASLTLGGIAQNVAACNLSLLGLVTVNEETCSGDRLVVRALHILIPNIIEIIAAESSAGAVGCPCAVCQP
jgi:hypothetical protein